MEGVNTWTRGDDNSCVVDTNAVIQLLIEREAATRNQCDATAKSATEVLKSIGINVVDETKEWTCDDWRPRTFKRTDGDGCDDAVNILAIQKAFQQRPSGMLPYSSTCQRNPYYFSYQV